MRSLLLGLLFLTVANESPAQTPTLTLPSHQTGSWSATSNGGQTLMGTWTATLDTAGTVVGTWALLDAQGNTRIDGAWSAAKSPQGWTGAWRAVISGRDGEYSGTWTATIDLKPDARLADLVAKGMETVVNGNWRAGTRFGAWAIRTFK